MALISLVVLVASAPAAAAYPGDGRYPLPPPPRAVDRFSDVAVLADGGVVAAAAGEGTWYLGPGTTRWQRIPGVAASGVSATADGAVLATDVFANRIMRWRPGASATPVAGTGTRGYGGDGTRALLAPLSLSASDPQSSGIAALTSGGFLFADTYNNRIRVVDPAGVIHTVAGTGRPGPAAAAAGAGDGGPAASAPVAAPVAVAALPDGGFVLLESEAGRIRRVGSDGLIRTVARSRSHSSVVGGDLVALPDGRILLIDEQMPRWLPGTGPAGTPFPGRDVAGRALDCVDGAGAEGRSVFLAGCGPRVWWVPRGGSPHRAVAVRDLRIDRTGVHVVAESSAPGRISLRIQRRGHNPTAEIVAQTAGGHAAIERAGRLAADWHRVVVSLDGGWGDAVYVWGGQQVTRRMARRLLAPRVAGGDPGAAIYLGRRCRSYGPRRVDCEVTIEQFGVTGTRCNYIASIVLPRTGIVRQRGYSCGSRRRALFQADPTWRPELASRVTPDSR